VSDILSLRGLIVSLVVVCVSACGGADEEATNVGQTTQGDADAAAVTLPDTDPSGPDLTPTPSDSVVLPDSVDDVQEVEVDTGPPPECTPETSWKCEDGDICTEDSCTEGVCIHAAIPGCCKAAEDCDDGVPCTIDECNPTKSECLHSFETNKCCVTVDDCAEADVCDLALCAGHECIYPVVQSSQGCECSTNLDCADGSACTDDVCSDGICVYEPSGAVGCCVTAADCDDGEALSADQCHAGICWSGPLSCLTDGDCVGPNACSSGSCLEGVCSYASECCLLDSECDDGQAATNDQCIDGSCVSMLDEEGAECASDGDCVSENACAVGTCVIAAGKCSFAPAVLAGCCQDSSDCPQPQACTSATCEDFTCGVANGADETVHWSADWDDGTLGGWTVDGDGKGALWQISDVQAVSAPNSLYYGQVPEMNFDVGHTQGTVTSPAIPLPNDLTDLTLTFWRSADIEPLVSTDHVRLELIQDGAVSVLWDKSDNAGPGIGWKQEVRALEVTANATISLRFVFDSVDEKKNGGMGVLVDDVKLVTPCP
jgi:hypothetical protein